MSTSLGRRGPPTCSPLFSGEKTVKACEVWCPNIRVTYAGGCLITNRGESLSSSQEYPFSCITQRCSLWVWDVKGERGHCGFLGKEQLTVSIEVDKKAAPDNPRQLSIDIPEERNGCNAPF